MQLSAVQKRRCVIGCFFLVYFLIGLSVVGDYPIPVDEPVQDLLGQESWDMMRGASQAWTSLPDIRLQAPFVETIIHAVDSAFISPRPVVTPGYVILRHFLVFLFYFAGVVVFYLLASRTLGDWVFALYGCAMLILTPRFFAHSFINSKDLPTVGLFIIAVYAIVLLLDRPSLRRAVFLGIALGATTATRPMGLFLFVMTAIGGVVQGFHAQPVQRRQLVGACGLALLLGTLTTVLFWPLLWTHPFLHFQEVLAWSKRAGGGFYFGETVDYTPWHYLPVWIAITVPPTITILCIAGFLASVLQVVRSRSLCRNHVLFALWVFLPWLAIVATGAGIFDEWRHVFFLYPGMVLFALVGLQWLLQLSARLQEQTAYRVRVGMLSLLALLLLRTGYWMLRNHPLEFAYFSIPAQFVENRFELDYWALASRKALQIIAQHDPRPEIRIAVTNNIIGVNAAVFFRQPTFVQVEPDTADYIIDNFRGNGYAHLYPKEKIFASIVVDGVAIMNVYRGPITTENVAP